MDKYLGGILTELEYLLSKPKHLNRLACYLHGTWDMWKPPYNWEQVIHDILNIFKVNSLHNITDKMINKYIIDVDKHKNKNVFEVNPIVCEAMEELNMREKFHDIRKRGIGGSDLPKLLGISKYGTPRTLWEKKTGRNTEKEVQSEPAYWGSNLEDKVAQRFQEEHPEWQVWCVTPAVAENLKWRHEDYDGLSAIIHEQYDHFRVNYDRLVYKPETNELVPLEIKTASAWKGSEWDDGKVPYDYQIQCQWQMMFQPYFKYAHVAVLIGGNDYREADLVIRDDSLINNLIKVADVFWKEFVQKDIEPPVSAGDTVEYKEAIKGSIIELPQYVNKVHELNDVIDKVKFYEKKEKEIKNMIKEAMSGKEEAHIGTSKCTYKLQSGKKSWNMDSIISWSGMTKEEFEKYFKKKGNSYAVFRIGNLK